MSQYGPYNMANFKYIQIYLPTGQKWTYNISDDNVAYMTHRGFKHPTELINDWNRTAALISPPMWFYYIP